MRNAISLRKMEKKVKEISVMTGSYDEIPLVSGDKFDMEYSDFELHVKTNFCCKIIILRPTDLSF